jgi:hypothetical protein
MTTDSYELPGLPALENYTERVEVWGLMQDYARQAIAADRERMARLCESMKTRPPRGGENEDDSERGFNAGLRRAAEAIRSANHHCTTCGGGCVVDELVGDWPDSEHRTISCPNCSKPSPRIAFNSVTKAVATHPLDGVELPPPVMTDYVGGGRAGIVQLHYYSATQMREYALLAVQRERERCIAACRKVRQDLDEYAERNNYHGDAWEYIDKCEAAIRKG